jgi:hypothetical protein
MQQREMSTVKVARANLAGKEAREGDLRSILKIDFFKAPAGCFEAVR